MEQVMMWIMAVGVVIGGVDRILGNRFGLGKRFEEGFELLGPTALSMAGIICLAPLLTAFLQQTVVPVWQGLGFDPAMLGGVLAIDMGGYQLSVGLAESSRVGRYAGIIVAAVLGCTVTFTIPVGMGLLEEGDRPEFARGMLIGLGVMPVAFLVGGVACGLSLPEVLWQSLPVILFSLALMAALRFCPERSERGFARFAALLRYLTTVGLVAGAVTYMTGLELLPGLAPLADAMEVVSSVGIVLLGSLPVAELLRRILRRPLRRIGEWTGMNEASIAGLLMGGVSVVPAIAMMKDMDRRGKVANGAFLVCAASGFAAHMGFTFGVDRSCVPALLAAKLAGGLAGVGVALAVTKKEKA